MKSSSIVSHPEKSPSGRLKATIPLLFLLLGMGTRASPAEDLDFFPLQIGNRWTYVDLNIAPPDTFTVSITDTQRVEGQAYYIFQGIARLFLHSAQESLYRKDSKGDVCVYYPEQRRECPRFRFSIDPWGGWRDSCFVLSEGQANPPYWFSRPEDLQFLRLRGVLPNYVPIEGREGVNLWYLGFLEFLFVSDIGIVLVQPELSWPIFLIDAVVAGKRVSQATLVRSTSWGSIKAETR